MIMEKTAKYYLSRIVVVLLNLIVGAIGIVCFACAYSFIFEKEYAEHDVKMGAFTFFMGLLAIIFPNISVPLLVKWKKPDIVFFQLIPLVLGAVIYCWIQRFYY